LSAKRLPKPAAWKNTYFWIAAILFVVGVVGLPFVKGEQAIRDPGQSFEPGLPWIYFGAAVVMLVNGLLSHAQTLRQYAESIEEESNG
jgi:hypothetical protein